MIRRVAHLALVFAATLSVGAWLCAPVYAVDAPSIPHASPDTRPTDDPLTRLAEKLAASDAKASTGHVDAASSAAPPPEGREALPLGPALEHSTGAAGSAAPPTPGQDGQWVLNTLTSLGVVIGVILLARWGWMKMGGTVTGRGSSVVEVLSRTTVAPRNHVLLLRVGGRVLVVGDSTAGLRTLASIEDPDEVASVLEAVTAARGNSISRGFSQLLAHTDQDFQQQRLAEEGGDHTEYRFDRARDSVSGLLSRIRTLSQKEGTP